MEGPPKAVPATAEPHPPASGGSQVTVRTQIRLGGRKFLESPVVERHQHCMRPVQACGWTGECSEPGCSDKCVPAFSYFANFSSITLPPKAYETMTCPMLALYVAAANRMNVESSSRKLLVGLLSFTHYCHSRLKGTSSVHCHD